MTTDPMTNDPKSYDPKARSRVITEGRDRTAGDKDYF